MHPSPIRICTEPSRQQDGPKRKKKEKTYSNPVILSVSGPSRKVDADAAILGAPARRARPGRARARRARAQVAARQQQHLGRALAAHRARPPPVRRRRRRLPVLRARCSGSGPGGDVVLPAAARLGVVGAAAAAQARLLGVERLLQLAAERVGGGLVGLRQVAPHLRLHVEALDALLQRPVEAPHPLDLLLLGPEPLRRRGLHGGHHLPRVPPPLLRQLRPHLPGLQLFQSIAGKTR